MALFELDWLGGAAERAFALHKGDRLEAIPWASLPTGHLTAEQRDHHRVTWTLSAHQEWCAAGGFTALLHAMLAARAPVDLIGMAGRFVADEMVHVELAARMAAAYGGGVALDVDAEAVSPVVDGGLDAIQRLCELAIRVSCVGETFSFPLLAHELANADDPVTQAVLQRVVEDEAPHARVGWLVLDWALPRVGEAERERLASVTLDALDALEPAMSQAEPALKRIGLHVRQTRIVEPLRRRGVPLPA